MVSTSSLIDRVRSEHADHLTFTPGASFSWSPTTKTVYYVASGDASYLLHELAHALLSHAAYRQDIELISMEREAWTYAVDALAPRYEVTIPDDTIQTSLDTYRDWLHQRSGCPACSATGLQSTNGQYSCPVCHTTWHASEAKFCQLRKTVG